VRPTIGWHIDPFGHASTQASLFAQMGFNAFFFSRIDYQDYALRNKTKEMEIVWRGSESLGQETEIFTSVMYDGYGPPDGFCFECDNVPPIQDDPRLFGVNIKERADKLAAEIKTRQLAYRTNNIMLAFGSDFQFENANINFKNMDKLMRYINAHPEYELNMFYSTPSIYIEYVHKAAEEKNIAWTVKTDDFFPYADCPHCFWTGYFTSRPALKGYVRTRSNLLHATEKLITTARGDVDGAASRENVAKYEVLAQAMGVAQHHDAVAGTEKQHVADDYAERLSIGSDNAQEVVSEVVGKLLARQSSPSLPSFSYCPHLNMSVCPATAQLANNKAVPVVAYNPLAWTRTFNFRIPVPVPDVAVVVSTKVAIATQTVRSGDASGLPFILEFSLDLPPMGYLSFVLQRGSSANDRKLALNDEAEPATGGAVAHKQLLPSGDRAGRMLENKYLRATFSSVTNRLELVENLLTGQKVVIDQGLLWYNSSTGNNKLSIQPSGAYIFRPNETYAFNMTKDNVPSIQFLTGPLSSEVRQVFNSWATQTVRLYADQPFLEFEYTIGPIDISDNRGKEVITRYATRGFSTDSTWYTDSQGQEMQKRRYNYRPTWPLNVTEPVAGNYYPMNSAAFLRSGNAQITVVNDRSQACGSVADGELEVMLHRRLLHDDYRGVGEPLNETEAVRTVHRLSFTSVQDAGRALRTTAYHINNPPVLLFANFAGNANAWFGSYNATYLPLVAALPPNVHLLNLRTLPLTGEVLLRVAHIYAVGEDSALSKPAQVDLSSLFKHLRVTKISEMNLSANQLKSQVKRFKWKTASSSATTQDDEPRKEVSADLPIVDLRPMEIRTFIVRLERQ
jgi:lysosomal alpha-mannosidase